MHRDKLRRPITRRDDMKTPHTHYTRGKAVWVKLRDGQRIIGKFVERKGRFVTLDVARIEMRAVAAMGFRNHNASK